MEKEILKFQEMVKGTWIKTGSMSQSFTFTPPDNIEEKGKVLISEDGNLTAAIEWDYDVIIGGGNFWIDLILPTVGQKTQYRVSIDERQLGLTSSTGQHLDFHR